MLMLAISLTHAVPKYSLTGLLLCVQTEANFRVGMIAYKVYRNTWVDVISNTLTEHILVLFNYKMSRSAYLVLIFNNQIQIKIQNLSQYQSGSSFKQVYR